MEKFEFTVLATISKGIEVEAEDYDAALAEVRRLFKEGELDETHGYVRVEAADVESNVWESVGEYWRS